jgi:hypothetical protein
MLGIHGPYVSDRSPRAGIDTNGRQSRNLPFRNAAREVRTGVPQRGELSRGGQRPPACCAMEDNLSRLVDRQPGRIEGGQGIQQRARDSLGGKLHRLPDIDQQYAVRIEQVPDFLGLELGNPIGSGVGHVFSRAPRRP